jgi:hypothetical protein
MISSNIYSFVDSSTIINCSDFKALIISSEDLDPKEQIKNGISGLDFGNCLELLKDQYKIPNEEDLIVLEIETKEDKEKNKYLDKSKDSINLGKYVEIAVYDYNGSKLNLGFCEEDITVIKLIDNLEDIDISEAMDLAGQGVDVFNAQDSFFNDICHPFKNKNDSDITLKDRRSDIFQNVTFCGNKCKYNGINYEIMTVNCICDAEGIQIQNKEDIAENKDKRLTLNDLANSFTSNLLDFNFIVIKCYNLVFEKQILKKNIGFFVLFCMIILQMLFLIIFSIKCLKPIRNYMLILKPFDQNIDPPNPPKKKEGGKKYEDERTHQDLESNSEIKKYLSKKEKKNQKSYLN